ncbi:coenzyme PQQ synthesis protein D [Acetobacter pasteurianus]|uniref:pyrroloquinoline quinone biosynthesis peptide chaperone PqqD n=1 Tax=Acetobacter pasteurianus TaxID=438 RepID=UPI0022BBF2A0|nr:pyrroloquinoline quinone biosynthesis peptide chaperone PqqD [Acetobacter pasteurianus]GLH29198.1 coenzyme PQQ synthesis protein D [Acetobacter pasteurianus]
MISENSILRFARGTRLQHDRVRDVWFIQAPERAFHADPIAVEVLQLIDGTHNVGGILDLLCQKFAAPRDIIAQDVLTLLRDLATKQVLQAI